MVAASFTGIMISNYAVSVTRDFHNGFLAGIILITLSPFPLYLINWSRYPFLISLIFDLTVFSLVHRAIISREPVPKWLIILLSVYASLIHYSSAYLIFIFTISCVISTIKADTGLKSLLQQIKSNYWIVLIPLVLVIYVFISINHGYGFQNLIMLRSEEVESYGQIIGLASKRFGWLVILLSVISLIRQLIEKDRNGVLFLCFLSLLFIGQIVQKIIFDAMFFSWINLMILIMCLLPLLTSSLLVDVGERLFKVPEFQGIAFITLILGLIQIGFSSISSVIQPSITRFTSNDFVVINWIKTNFRDEKFLINFMDWGGEIVPSDAGGWIGIMTDNHIVQPLYSSVDSSLCEWIRNEKPNYYLDGHGEKFVNYHQLDCVEFSEITVQGEEIIYQVKILDQY